MSIDAMALMQMTKRLIAGGLFVWSLSVLPLLAAKPWDTLTNCMLVENRYNDGDSFHVEHDGKEYIFRLYFVDTPEDDLSFPQRVDEQGRYFGTDRDQTTYTGVAAQQLMKHLLAEPFTVITRWHSAQGRSRIPRFYAFVRPTGADLGEELIKNGLARVYGVRASTPEGEKATEYRARLLKMEDTARLEKQGAWEYASPIAAPKKRIPKGDLRVVEIPRTVATYTEDLPRRRLGELQRGKRVRVLEEFPDGWVQIEYDLSDDEVEEAFCLRWDLSLPDYAPATAVRARAVP
ncbi:MAG: thermonuclease family protein [Kiritimatiellae bacterium]|nr:thermonuclease family protein [Kiritimatiellia bacterium]